jgi:tetratricopeptide (TPR) repeat protein
MIFMKKYILILGLVIISSFCGCNKNSEEEVNRATLTFDELIEAGIENQDSGRLQEALVDFDKAIQINPQVALAYVFRGSVYGLLSEFTNAFADFNKAIQLDPNLAIAYFQRGAMYGARGETDNVITDFDKAIELDPSLFLAYYYRGLIYDKLGKTEKAKLDFAKAKELGYEPE